MALSHQSSADEDGGSQSGEDAVQPVRNSSPDEEDELTAPHSGLSHRFRKSPSRAASEVSKASRASSIAIVLSGPSKPWEYKAFDGDETVDAVLNEIEGRDDGLWYKIEYESGRQEEVSKFDISASSCDFVPSTALY